MTLDKQNAKIKSIKFRHTQGTKKKVNRMSHLYVIHIIMLHITSAAIQDAPFHSSHIKCMYAVRVTI